MENPSLLLPTVAASLPSITAVHQGRSNATSTASLLAHLSLPFSSSFSYSVPFLPHTSVLPPCPHIPSPTLLLSFSSSSSCFPQFSVSTSSYSILVSLPY
ncbi:hypothetical protein E2C01_059168 [Portunus trituberculatus]|uniref:Uncharacterized protein n=1 Tax=Portunus trituberculatus TaxID=210409 RepID=A0A5B7H8C6_PORTR|nr:hypothetical protein [Portunus trituberculatus]